MDYLELTIAVRPEAVEEAADLLRRRARGGVSIEQAIAASDEDGAVTLDSKRPVRLRAWLPASAGAHAAVAGLRSDLRAIDERIARSLRSRIVNDDSWAGAWKRHFRTLHIGRSLVVRPSWRKYTPKRGEVVIEIDPGMAFGTGQHETTRLCLEALEERCERGATVLDLGCGSGILGIAAGLLGARHVDALDLDPVAVRATAENAGRNSVERIVRARQGSLGAGRPFRLSPVERYDLVLANLSSRIVQELAGPIVAALRPGGVAIVSGLIGANERACARALRRARGRVAESRKAGEWVLLVVERATGRSLRTSRTPGRPRRPARRSPSAGAGPSRARSRRSTR